MTAAVRPVRPTFLRLDRQIGWRLDTVASRDIRDDDIDGGLRLSGSSATTISPIEPTGTFGGVTRATGVAVGSDGRLFLADPNANQILTYAVWQSQMLPLWESRQSTPPDGYTLAQPRGVAIDRDGDLLVSDTGHRRVIVYTLPHLAVRKIIDLEAEPWDIAVDSIGRIHIALPSEGRVVRYDRLWRRDTRYEGGAGLLRQPRHLAIDEDDRLYVVDDTLKLVVELDQRGRPGPDTATFAGLISTVRQVSTAAGATYQAAPDLNQVLVRTAEGAPFVPLESLAPSGTVDTFTFVAPRGVAVSGDARMLAVADTGRQRVVVFRLPGHVPLRTIAMSASGEPYDVAFDRLNRLYVADHALNRIERYTAALQPDSDYAGGAGVLHGPIRIAATDDGQLVVRDERSRQLIALDEQGLVVREELIYRRRFPPPLRVDGGVVAIPQDSRPECPALLLPRLQIDRQGRVRGPIRPAGQYPALIARPSGIAFPRSGRVVTQALDSGMTNCQWHRVVLDASVPESTGLTVRTFTAPAAIEPHVIDALPDERWSVPLATVPGSVPEVLVQSPPGRYLWLRVDLVGNGQTTPLIRGIDIYAPRNSSLAFLPPIFREDPVSADFLDRFLSFFDTVFSEIETQVEGIAAQIDPDGATASDFLPWLASWLDIQFLPQWPEPVRREFVRQAISLYRQRGTVEGLSRILRLHAGAIDPLPVIVEHFRLRDYLSRRDTGADDLLDGRPYLAGSPLALDDMLDHTFTVVVPHRVALDEPATETLRQIINAQKPAHTQYDLRVVHPGIRVGCQSTIGVDTLLGEQPPAALDEIVLGQQSQLAPPTTEVPQLGRSRLSFSA